MAYTNIDDPSAHFQTLVFTGTGGLNLPVTHTNTGNSDLQPDLIWFKDRGAGYSHAIMDSSRGRAKVIYPDVVNSEASSGANDDLVSFDTDGFKVGAPSSANSTNGGTTSKVAWQWKANAGTTSSNTDGNITSTVQSNQDAGFSIVTYTGNGSNNQTIGHGLGVQPSWWIVKRRDSTGDWWFGASSILGGTSNYLKLNSEAINAESNNIWGDSPTSSTLFRVSNNAGLNASGGTYVAYLFANKQGYSKFGKYVGNTNTDGAFVYTGFKPAFVLIKKYTTSADSWVILDTARNPYNGMDARLFPDLANSESTSQVLIDSLSNGFKMRTADTAYNGSGVSYIYMAFAESSFVTSSGIPTTAR